jgi:DNA-directed RNA polymerase subunit E"
MNTKACRKCRKIIEEKDVVGTDGKTKKEIIKECPICGSKLFTTFWKGTALIVDPENSEIAKAMDVKTSGKYALRLSR